MSLPSRHGSGAECAFVIFECRQSALTIYGHRPAQPISAVAFSRRTQALAGASVVYMRASSCAWLMMSGSRSVSSAETASPPAQVLWPGSQSGSLLVRRIARTTLPTCLQELTYDVDIFYGVTRHQHICRDGTVSTQQALLAESSGGRGLELRARHAFT